MQVLHHSSLGIQEDGAMGVEEMTRMPVTIQEPIEDLKVCAMTRSQGLLHQS